MAMPRDRACAWNMGRWPKEFTIFFRDEHLKSEGGGGGGEQKNPYKQTFWTNIYRARKWEKKISHDMNTKWTVKQSCMSPHVFS
jgi:hypothetical protein